MSQRRCHAYILITGCLWGTIGLFVKMLEHYGSTPAFTAFMRMAFGFVILAAFTVMHEGKAALRIHRKTLVACVVLGLLSQGLYNLTYNMAICRIGVSYSAVLLNSAPFFTAVMSGLIFREKIGKVKKVGIILNVTGCTMAVAGNFSGIEGLDAKGILYALITAACYAICPIAGKLTDERDSGTAVATYCALFAALFLMVFDPMKGVAFDNWGKLFLTGILFALCTTGIADIFWYTGVKNLTGSSRAPVIASVSLIASAMSGIVILGERITLINAAGLMVVLLSIVIINIKTPKQS